MPSSNDVEGGGLSICFKTNVVWVMDITEDSHHTIHGFLCSNIGRSDFPREIRLDLLVNSFLFVPMIQIILGTI